jgi:hypothetical protein
MYKYCISKKNNENRTKGLDLTFFKQGNINYEYGTVNSKENLHLSSRHFKVERHALSVLAPYTFS